VPHPRACLLALLLVWTPCANAADQATARLHEAALAAARQGNFDLAVASLRQLMRRHPREALFLHDTISVLQRAGRARDALDLLARVDRQRAPAYVLESLGAAACAEGRDGLCDSLYLGVLDRHPGREESLRGLAGGIALRVLADAQVPADLRARLAVLAAEPRAQVLQRAADIVESKGRLYPALHLTLAALEAQPSHTPALAARIRLAARLGADHLALQLAEARPGTVDGAQLAMLRRHVAAVDGR